MEDGAGGEDENEVDETEDGEVERWVDSARW